MSNSCSLSLSFSQWVCMCALYCHDLNVQFSSYTPNPVNQVLWPTIYFLIDATIVNPLACKQWLNYKFVSLNYKFALITAMARCCSWSIWENSRTALLLSLTLPCSWLWIRDHLLILITSHSSMPVFFTSKAEGIPTLKNKV